MTSMIKIKYVEYAFKIDEEAAEANSTDKEMLVNIDCPVGLILEYIRDVALVNKTCEIDLCDEMSCQLKNLVTAGSYTSGLEVLQPDLTYIIVICERGSNGQLTNVTPLVCPKTAKRYNELLAKIRKTFRKNSATKLQRV